MYKDRIKSIDAVRGILIIGVIIYHFMYNLVALEIIPANILYNPLMNFIQYFGACLFIMISGISAKFSRSNFKRGVRTLLFGILLTVVTYILNPDAFIMFGILHFLGVASIIYSFIGDIKLHPSVFIILFFISKLIMDKTYDIKHLWIFGITDKSFISTDYFPIFPFIFIYYFGTKMADIIKNTPKNNLIYTYDNKYLSYVGRNTILIYIIHQPILMIITLFLKKII